MSNHHVSTWNDLRLLLSEHLEPEGKLGFEGLMARLFEAETGQPFFLARSGDQPAGDAYGPLAGIALQAKRYTVSKIAGNNVEGDIDRALRETPGTDIFIVASTKADNQLKLRLEKKTEETGVDLILLALNEMVSPLGALCVAHWGIVRDFLPTLHLDSDLWATAQLVTADLEKALDQLRSELSGLPSRVMVSRLARDKMSTRVHGGVIGACTHNRVDITNGVQRSGLRRKLECWWEEPGKGIAVLEGEEGAGKTWIAADFAFALPTETPIVLWLDSLVWSQTKNVEEIVRLGLETLFPLTDKRAARIEHKVFRRWREPVLIVLDGANERGAWGAAERLLYDYYQHDAKVSGRVRVLFTSRPLVHRPRGGQNFWGDARVIRVGPFDDKEFAAALEKFAPSVNPQALTNSVRELARVPRYFHLCLQLRERLASFTHLNREVLLWVDLESKLDRRDPQWLGLQEELNGSPTEILAFLAERVGWPTSETTSIATAELRQLLPGLDRVRADLRDQRIVVAANLSETILSAEHLVLGWALVLQRVAEAHDINDLDAVCDRLERLLEPAASNDSKARAVHVAALLTFFNMNAYAISARSALLRLWVLHHNAVVNDEALAFFVRTDLTAYLDTVEALFRGHLRGYLETTLIAPLAILWRHGDGDLDQIRNALERWLRLVFPGDASGSYDLDQLPPSQFIAARTVEQLRLSYAAISIISFRPEASLLPAIADCAHSDDFCYAYHNKTSMRFPIKRSTEPLGLLVRWHYGQALVEKVVKLAKSHREDSVGRKNIHQFARLWRLAKLPNCLGDPKDIRGNCPPQDDENLFAHFRDLLTSQGPRKRNLLGLDMVGRLAVRHDLPALKSWEVDRLSAEADKMIAFAARDEFPGTQEEQALNDVLPYLARYRRDAMAEVMRILWRSAIGTVGLSPRFFHLDERMPASDPGGELVAAILTNTKLLLSREHANAVVPRLTEFMLIHADLSNLIIWLRAISTLTVDRASDTPIVCLLPLPSAFSYLAPAGLDCVAHSEAQEALEDFDRIRTDDLLKQASHWLQVLAYVSEGFTSDIGCWALDLADRFGDQKCLQFPLFCIISRCADMKVLMRAIRHTAFAGYSLGFNAWRWSQAFPVGAWPSFRWEELKAVTSFTVGGWLIHRGGCNEEICAWGRDFASATLDAASAWPVRSSQICMEVRVGNEGQIEGTALPPMPVGQETWTSVASPIWGVDRQVHRPAPTQADADRVCEALRVEMEMRRVSIFREFVNFNAAGPLAHWSDLAPEEFASWAKEILRRVEEADPMMKFETHFLVDTIVILLLRIEPDFVVGPKEIWKGDPQIRVVTCGGAVLRRVEELWDQDLDRSDAVNAVRRRLLLQSENDEEILHQVLAAHNKGNAAAITSLAVEWLQAEEARDRALAVSIMAFHGDAKDLECLRALCKNDHSFWVREHARWALDVCATESACRHRYRELLAAVSLEEVFAGLVEISPALSPMAIAWRTDQEHGVLLTKQHARNRGAIELFWGHWDNCRANREDVSLAGRKLRGYCRGERMQDGISSQMAPWWVLE